MFDWIFRPTARLIAPSSNGQVVRLDPIITGSQQRRLVFLQPGQSDGFKRFCLGHAFRHGRLRNDVSGIFGEVALLSQLVQADQGRRINPKGFRQRLDCRLMVSRFARQRSVSMGVEPHVRKHTNRRVRTRKACLWTDRLHFGVGNMARSAVKQAPNSFFLRRDLLKAYAQQVAQAHVRHRSEIFSASPGRPSRRNFFP